MIFSTLQAAPKRRVRINRIADIDGICTHFDSKCNLTDHVACMSNYHVANGVLKGLTVVPNLSVKLIYGNGLKPSSFKKALCFCLAVAIAFSISTSSPCVASRSISASPTAVLM